MPLTSLTRCRQYRDRLLAPPDQKFRRGDIVRVADDLPTYMSRFRIRGRTAVVLGSFRDLHVDGSQEEYSLWIPRIGQISWCPDSVLELVERQEVNK